MTKEETELRAQIAALHEQLGEAVSEQRWREVVHEINVLILRLKKILPPVGT